MYKKHLKITKGKGAKFAETDPTLFFICALLTVLGRALWQKLRIEQTLRFLVSRITNEYTFRD